MSAPLSILGRLCLTTIFLVSVAAEHIPHFNQVVATMQQAGIPNARLMHVGAIAFMLVGGLSVLFGCRARLGAVLLAVFLGLAMYYIHDFWTLTDPAQQQEQMIHFMKNLSMLGAMLFIIANGPGAGSIDCRRITLTV